MKLYGLTRLITSDKKQTTITTAVSRPHTPSLTSYTSTTAALTPATIALPTRDGFAQRSCASTTCWRPPLEGHWFDSHSRNKTVGVADALVLETKPVLLVAFSPRMGSIQLSLSSGDLFC